MVSKNLFCIHPQNGSIGLQVILPVIQPFYEKKIGELFDHGERVSNPPCPEIFLYPINLIFYFSCDHETFIPLLSVEIISLRLHHVTGALYHAILSREEKYLSQENFHSLPPLICRVQSAGITRVKNILTRLSPHLSLDIGSVLL
jgi:hypothetical protein